jgi:tRNA pseudouridine32 synthase/23S rRNA pseudouridine746 synthase
MSTPQQQRQVFTADIKVSGNGPRPAIDILARHTGLPKARLKDAMAKGAVWLARGGRRPARLRRVTTPLGAGDFLQIYYDSDVLAAQPPQARCVRDLVRYSVWDKPAGLLAEGSRFGDHATLARQVELALGRPVFLVHRLDREASGLILIAHKPQAAARLSALFRERQVRKQYRIDVRGCLGEPGANGGIHAPLDGKEASTDYEVLAYDAGRDTTQVMVTMKTGRYHQIRRHFLHLGFPVMGDPKYGERNADPRGMQLAAVGLCFPCPWTGESMEFRVVEGADQEAR